MMPQTVGKLCIVLHSHLPYVLNHGTSPHGEAWLFEAMAEVYLPLLDLIGEVALNGVHPGLSVGLTPVLLEQLANLGAQAQFVKYLNRRIEQAESDESRFERSGQADLARIAQFWRAWHRERLAHFERIGRNLPREFAMRAAEGHIELLAGCATHAYLPLLRLDSSIRAQFAAGAQVSRRILGSAPTGVWLPECGYRPSENEWQSPILPKKPIARVGIESFLTREGIDHFFVESGMLKNARPLGTSHGDSFTSTSHAQLFWDSTSWGDVLEPVGVSSDPQPARVYAMARHPEISEQVWSNQTGYPGDGAYLEFHKKASSDGLRYWRVTDISAEMDHKSTYDPHVARGRVHAHAQHFCQRVTALLKEHRQKTGRSGICTAMFDAELFGHWWFEGPRFLRDVLLTLAAAGEVRCSMSADALGDNPTKVVRLPEGSWGRGGDHQVWLNDKTQWMWEVEHRAEMRFDRKLRELPWQQFGEIASALKDAGRELLLLQASDWPFIVENGSATDYAIERFSLHSARFNRAVDIASTIHRGDALNDLQLSQQREMRLHDDLFANVDLNWWSEP